MTIFKNCSDVSETGDWATDNRNGRELASAIIAAASANANPCLLATAMRDLAQSGRWGGVEVGFAYTLGVALIG